MKRMEYQDRLVMEAKAERDAWRENAINLAKQLYIVGQPANLELHIKMRAAIAAHEKLLKENKT